MERSVKAVKVISVVIFLFFLGFYLGGTAWAQEGVLTIKYEYKNERGSLGVYGIADSATAYLGDIKVGQARAIRIIRKEPGPNQLEVEETHFSRSGSVIYQGRIIFRFSYGGARPEEETAISGVKRFKIFSSWPSGR